MDNLLDGCPQDEIIGDNLVRAWSKINSPLYKSIVCSISGGADSDVVLDICSKCDKDHKIRYVWFDTGLEYQATKDHLKYLEEKYNIKIEPKKAVKPIPTACKQFGQPFISKNVSEFMSRLQRHGFKWEDEAFDVLIKKYQKCSSALKWWCNDNGKGSSFNIMRNKWLKEFIIANPPEFMISNKCCLWAKKKVAHAFKVESNADLSIVGVRKAEGGSRAAAYKTCFTCYDDVADEYRPIWWYLNDTKKTYEDHYDILHSKCYTEYGLPRTGCAGCPFGRGFEEELKVIEKYEPKLFVAVNNIFGDSYAYTREYRRFYKTMNEKE